MASPRQPEQRLPALYMLWSSHLAALSAYMPTPAGYELRQCQYGDQEQLHTLLAGEGWPLDPRHWTAYVDQVVPGGLFTLWHVPTQQLVGTAGAIHNPRGGRYYFPFGGQVAYLVVQREHRGHGLGAVLTAHAVQRLRAAGYMYIWLGVQDHRLPAIKTYFKLGFVPLLHQDGLAERWQRICEQLGWDYTPDTWPKQLDAAAALQHGTADQH